MKHPRYLLAAISMALASTFATAQTPEDAEASFTTMKALEGLWEGTMTATPPQPGFDGNLVTVSLRVTSRGHALLHDMKIEGIPDNPITMFYLDEDRLFLTHYCDAGNRPRMEGKATADGKIEFDFRDLTGGTQRGHMHHVLFTVIDADRHVEEWTFRTPGGQHMSGRFDLRRVE